MRISDWSSDECSSYLFRSLNLCHRERLATQSQDAFRQWVPESPLTTCIARDGNFDQSADNVYALVQTAAARVDEIKKYDVGAVDEAHHVSDTKTGDYATVLPKLIEANPDIKQNGRAHVLTPVTNAQPVCR